MSLELKKQPASSVPNPPGTHETFFIDENGQPAFRSASGTTRPAVSVDGSPLVLNEQATAPAAENDKGKIYTKDVGGITEFFYRDDLANGGNEIQLTSNGSVNGGGGGGGGTSFSSITGGLQVVTAAADTPTTVPVAATAPPAGFWEIHWVSIYNAGTTTINVGINSLYNVPGLDFPTSAGAITISPGFSELLPFPYISVETSPAPSIALEGIGAALVGHVSVASYRLPQPGYVSVLISTDTPTQILASPPAGKVHAQYIPPVFVNNDALTVMLNQAAGFVVNGDTVPHSFTLSVSPDGGSTFNAIDSVTGLGSVGGSVLAIPPALKAGESLWITQDTAPTTLPSIVTFMYAVADESV